MGKSIERNYHIKEYLIKQPDTKLNDIIHSVSNYQSERIHHHEPDKRDNQGQPETGARAGCARGITPLIF